MSRIMFFTAGAVSVGAVVAILVVFGVLDTGSTTTQSPPSSTATSTPAPTTTVSSTPASANSVTGIYNRVSKGVV